MSQIVIVSGPSGAGKSSVCESLCERYDRTVHLETDYSSSKPSAWAASAP
jgi:adenylate kinase family enzyme